MGLCQGLQLFLTQIKIAKQDVPNNNITKCTSKLEILRRHRSIMGDRGLLMVGPQMHGAVSITRVGVCQAIMG